MSVSLCVCVAWRGVAWRGGARRGAARRGARRRVCVCLFIHKTNTHTNTTTTKQYSTVQYTRQNKTRHDQVELNKKNQRRSRSSVSPLVVGAPVPWEDGPQGRQHAGPVLVDVHRAFGDARDAQGEDGTLLLHPLPVVEAQRSSVESEHFGVGGGQGLVRQRNSPDKSQGAVEVLRRQGALCPGHVPPNEKVCGPKTNSA